MRVTPDSVPVNGSEFTAKAVRDWLSRVGVKTLFIEPGSPWENGYDESLNGKLRDELLNTEVFDTLQEAKVLIERWRRHYNGVRPHSSLGYRPPAPEAIQLWTPGSGAASLRTFHHRARMRLHGCNPSITRHGSDQPPRYESGPTRAVGGDATAFASARPSAGGDAALRAGRAIVGRPSGPHHLGGGRTTGPVAVRSGDHGARQRPRSIGDGSSAARGVGSGRELDRLCGCQDAYRWLCGGVSLNYHTLNDFRVQHAEALDDLFTQVVMRLVQKEVVDVRWISQDGTRIRASAGGGSFRRHTTLEQLQVEARAHLESLRQQADPQWSPRQAAAQGRAARERVQRIEEALDQVPELEASKARYGNRKRDARSKAKPVRSSTTDPTARKMKMGDGGFRPAYNVQLASPPASRAIVAVSVTNQGSDQQQSVPLRAQTEQRTGQKVKEHLLDGGFLHRPSIERAGEDGVAIYAPVQQTEGVDPTQPKRGDGPHVAEWRKRMAAPEAQSIYKERAATSELTNADLKTWRGLDRLRVRGITKVTCVALWAALAYNLMHFGDALLN